MSLGAFRALKNSITRKRNLEFELKAKGDSERVYPMLARYSEKSESSETIEAEELIYEVKATLVYGRRNFTGNVTYSLVNKNSEDNYINIEDKILAESILLGRSMIERISNTKERERLMENSEEYNLTDLEAALTRLAAGAQLQEGLLYQINSIRHLSAVRMEAQRVIIASPPPIDNVGQGGETIAKLKIRP